MKVNRVIEPNTRIEKEYLSIERVGRINLPKSIITDPEQIVGKYAKVELLPGDNLVDEKFVEFEKLDDNFLYNLNENDKVAISITVKSYASGFSGMIKPGDRISIMTYYSNSYKGFNNKDSDEEFSYSELDDGETNVIINPKLRNLEVISVNRISESINDFGTITLYVTYEQARLLVEAENSGNIHVVFVGRGDKRISSLVNEVE